ncbi:sensor histidine kinase [Kitasatospora sp. A2-31]|uniref:sensor histidine kinase n=1 Tax=Kitasatospora sp. A2-31 TaxID=2916414 RepID=UPI001EE9B8B7|nr:sensor histidine kinase [Kitasatospora sp. A2-31]MCG6497348.1 sensor histidine kinase [Kitasatospora sp. A2-31]
MNGRQRPGEAVGEVPRERGDGLPWTQADALVAVGAGMLDLLARLLVGEVGGTRGVGLPGFVLLVLSGVPLLARRRHPLRTLAVVLVLQCAIDLSTPMGIHFGAVLTVAVYSVGRNRAWPVTAAAVAATALVTMLSQSDFPVPSVESGVAAVASATLVAGGGLAVTRWQREVDANRWLLAERAVAEERRRIARELHDIVAHHITTMQLMAGGARANLADREVVQEALVTLESSGRLALREMRQLLDVLRAGDEPDAAPASPQPGADDLDRLVDESRRAGLPTAFTVRGPRRPLPPTLGLTVFRIVQESLTNARKYAGPASASVLLTYRADGITVEVRDDGRGAPSQDAGHEPVRGGYGLIGMRERVALHGGALRAGPRPEGGFAVVAELPLAPEETAEAAVQSGEADAATAGHVGGGLRGEAVYR